MACYLRLDSDMRLARLGRTKIMRNRSSSTLLKKLLLTAAGALACCGTANATITLDFDTPATGSNIITTPFVTTEGTITASASEGSSLSLSVFPGGSGNGLRHSQTTDSSFAQLAFDFDVTSVTFLFAGFTAGDFSAQLLDSALNVLDSFFDDDTNSDLPGGPVTLSGSGARFFRFLDSPSGGIASGVDNVSIETAVPAPPILALMGLGLVGLGYRRSKNKQMA